MRVGCRRNPTAAKAQTWFRGAGSRIAACGTAGTRAHLIGRRRFPAIALVVRTPLLCRAARLVVRGFVLGLLSGSGRVTATGPALNRLRGATTGAAPQLALGTVRRPAAVEGDRNPRRADEVSNQCHSSGHAARPSRGRTPQPLQVLDQPGKHLREAGSLRRDSQGGRPVSTRARNPAFSYDYDDCTEWQARGAFRSPAAGVEFPTAAGTRVA